MEEKNIMSEEYKCIRYETRRVCDTCDGFGRNDKLNTDECYSPKKNSINPEKTSIDDEFPRA